MAALNIKLLLHSHSNATCETAAPWEMRFLYSLKHLFVKEVDSFICLHIHVHGVGKNILTSPLPPAAVIGGEK
jgi:hypothetical protein